MTIADLFKWLLKPAASPLSLEEELEARAAASFHETERGAHVVGVEIGHLLAGVSPKVAKIDQSFQSLVHTVEKEITMSLPQNILDAIATIRAAIAGHADQTAAKDAEIASLNHQLSDLTASCAGHEAEIADLTAKLADKDAQLTDLENQLLAMVPAPTPAPTPAPAGAPADGSGSADVTP